MKLKAVVTQEAPDEIGEALGSSGFALAFLHNVVGGVFDVGKPQDYPAEYYVQTPDYTVCTQPGVYGVEVRLTGVSRGAREPKLFHRALESLEALVIETITEALGMAEDEETRVQVFVAIMVDGDIPGLPGTESYSSILETEAVWVTSRGVE